MTNIPQDHASAENAGITRILVIGRDQLIRSDHRFDVDFIPTGRSFVPEAPLGYAPTLLSRLEYLWDYFRGRYRLAILPVPAHGSRLHRLLAQPQVIRLLGALRPAGTHLALLDTGENPTLPEATVAALRPDLCWKLNLHPTANPLYRLLPGWAYPPATGWSRVPWKSRGIDLFLPPGEDSPARRVVLQWLERFRKEGRLKIRVGSDELSSSDLHEMMSDSRLVLSPAGVGFHQARHYQAMLHGAIPIISDPHGLQTTLEHGGNCLLYGDTEDAFRTLLFWAADHPEALESLSRSARKYALTHHTPEAISSHLAAPVAQD